MIDLRAFEQVRPDVDFTVRGLPAPQGSARAFIANRDDPSKMRAIVTTEANRSSSPLGAWRAAVRTQAQFAMEGRDMLLGPIGLLLTFVLPRPKGHLGARGNVKPSAPAYPAVKPDLDKLIRAIQDACSSVVWKDDNQIVRLAVAKDYGEQPGCRIGVTHPTDPLLAFEWTVG